MAVWHYRYLNIFPVCNHKYYITFLLDLPTVVLLEFISLLWASLLCDFLGTTPRLILLLILVDPCKYWRLVSVITVMIDTGKHFCRACQDDSFSQGYPTALLTLYVSQFPPNQCGRAPDFYFLSLLCSLTTASNDHTLPPLFPWLVTLRSLWLRFFLWDEH